MTKTHYKKFLVGLLFVVSIIANLVLFFLWQGIQHKVDDVASLQRKYPLISERSLDDKNDLLINFLPLRQKLHAITDPYKKSIAVYFQYLPTGTTISINEDAEFTAASLLKVPVVMAYYHKKEVLKQIDDPTVTLQKNELDTHFGDLYKRGAGAQINLGEAVRLALTKSDNTASLILADHISNDDFNFVYEGLDITPALEGDSPIISAQEYSSILRALYYSSVLNMDDSEKILETMTQSAFHSMLPSGIPPTVKVAHKIGVIDKQIYHDCGIIYAPNRPYSLCMISKSDRKTATDRMQTISKVVYNYVSSQ